MALTDSSSTIHVANIKKTIYRNILEAVIGPEIIYTLAPDECFIRKEGDLWDFKEAPSGAVNSLHKTILQIASFYNTYGGYIIYGVKEHENDLFLPLGIEKGTLDTKQLRDTLRSYTGESIDITYIECRVDIKQWNGLLGILHIPKRHQKADPLYFSKNGPADEKGKLLFEKDKAYIRIQDNCEPADKKQHLTLLFSDRTIDFDNTGSFRLQRYEPLYNNLPDRNLICSKFVGRDDIIEKLWHWLGDPLSYTKLLAGDGGKGKSSIAYEFAEEICKVSPYDFESVIWISAKKIQFMGHSNSFIDMPNILFYDLPSLLNALAERLGIPDEDIDGTTETHRKKTLRTYLLGLPSFIVIDDVDSLELNEQKKVMETVMQISGGKSRFLLTTRMNISYSTDACITVPGLEGIDYIDLVDMYSERFELSIPKSKYEKLQTVTDGSPLFTESLIRLIKYGSNIDDAIRQWKGESGDEVRQAALAREIGQLSPESRRVLYALSLMSDASATEIRHVTGYTIMKLEQCVNELSSLFLLRSPYLIKTEQRYAVSNNTAILVSQSSAKLLSDPKVIERNIKELRNSPKQKEQQQKSSTVGKAINQSLALLNDGRKTEALETIKSALSNFPHNKDLLFAQARCLMSLPFPSLEEARKTFRQAYDHGQTKRDFFYHWHTAEFDAKSPQGIIEVCKFALINNPSDWPNWEFNKAVGYWMLAQNYKAGKNTFGAFDMLEEAGISLTKIVNKSPPSIMMNVRELSMALYDEIWSLISDFSDRPHTIKAYDVAVNAITQGDKRDMWYDRAIKALDWLVRSTDVDNDPTSWHNFLDQKLKQVLSLIRKREKKSSF